MAPKSITKAVREEAESRLPKRQTTYGNLEAGDEVTLVNGSKKYRFLGARLNPDGTVESLDLYGPLGQQAILRSVLPEKVKMPGPRVAARRRRTKEVAS